MATAGFPPEVAGPDDAESLRGVAPEIVDATRRLLAKVRAGELGRPPQAGRLAGGAADEPDGIRAGWL